MRDTIKNILITGLPGTGKTTIIKKLADIFKEFNPLGFYTDEVLENGEAAGFLISTLNGDSRMLAHINLKSRDRVGRYHVDVKGFEGFLEKVFIKDKKTGLFIIDEIGKMECLSKKFCKIVFEILESDKPVIATIPDKGTGILSDIKKRDDIKLVEITADNREQKLKELTMLIRDLLLD